MSELIKNKNNAELKRLLYVAMTRAKHNLIFSASYGLTRNEDKSFIQYVMKYVDSLREINEIKEEVLREKITFQKTIFNRRFK